MKSLPCTILQISLIYVLLATLTSSATSSISLEIPFKIPGLSEPLTSSTSTGARDERKNSEWKIWKKFQAGREKEQEPSDAMEDIDTTPQKTPKKTWGDARRPSKTASDVVVTSNDSKGNTKAKPPKQGKQSPKKNDRGGDDIVYGPSKLEKKGLKEEKKQEKEKKTEERKQSKLSAYERKMADLEQKKKDKAQKRDQGEEDEEEQKIEGKNEEVDVEENSREPTQQTNQTSSDQQLESSDPVPPRRAAYLVMGAPPPQGPPPRFRSGSPSRQPQAMPPNQALVLATAVSVSSAFTKLWIILWITKRLAAEHEILLPQQHFVWECLNDRYIRDEAVFSKALATPAAGLSKFKWNKYVRAIRSHKNVTLPKPQVPTKTVIVVDITPHNQLDIGHLTDIVTFLIGAQRRNMLGKEPEIVMLLQSPGGEVTAYGLAAAQVARLEHTGIRVTVCVDSVAASGGYMIASQSSQIVAAPFAMVGSIGVIREGLNYNKLLTDYGIKPMVLKAGEMKNRLSSLGPVTDADIKAETERLEETHRAFIDWCLSRRPSLQTAVCDGTVLMGQQAISFGMVDRVLTSDEYIWERICDGDHVLKLHKSFRDTDRTRIFARALDLLPHLKHQLTRLQRQVHFGKLAQGYAILSVVQRALSRY
jgi:ClpP class serine protease